MSESKKPNRYGQTTNGSGRNINTGGGSYFEGGTFTNNGGITTYGGVVKGNTYNDNRISAGDATRLQDLFASLHKYVAALPTTTAAQAEIKAEVVEAAEELHNEVEAIKKNPEHKPKRLTMNGLILAFKKVGGPVLQTALYIIGYPALGSGINQFAKELEVPKS
jgi:hypothetical protein